MEIPVYLAMTATEFRTCSQQPVHTAWLSCLFSPYGRGLSNIPKELPPNSLLILSDRTPVCGHDPELIFQTLSQAIPALSCSGLLLDFERPGNREAMEIAKALIALPCPVALSASYAKELDCPVFVPLLPPSEPLEPHIAPWQGRDIWLEISNQAQTCTVTESGVTIRDCFAPPQLPQYDSDLICHYAIDIQDNAVSFTMQRTTADIQTLLAAGSTMHITRGIGLYQELN